MKHEDIKLSMKVVPFQKTRWNWDKEIIKDYYADADWGVGECLNSNGYLYVVYCDESMSAWVLGYDPEIEDGDFFNAEDFEPYNPINEGVYAQFKHEKLVNISQKEFKELKALRAFKEEIMAGSSSIVVSINKALAKYDEIMEGE